MAANCSQPVVIPGHYNRMFKVDVNLHAPLREHLASESDFKVDLLVHSLQLDTFCKQEQSQTLSKGDHGKSATSFQNKGINFTVVKLNLYPSFSSFEPKHVFKTYEREPHFAQLFPSVLEYMKTGATFNKPKSALVDSYLKQLAQVNHVLMLSRQIHEDIRCGEKPKYLAHQVAVLFQAMQSLPSGSELLARHKTNIEDNFQMLKSTIADLHDFETSLPQEVEEWLLELTDSITSIIHSMPSQLSQEIRPLASVFQSG
ncbi:hypothetical protein PoB_006658500 [Plakobranchus ocellatus]|uniref:BLOC-1-related complex subunit 5 n=1 Tax=Plakobranchus ocellatus TaxID=259542 RepID=A0AAV4D7X1_9GAST|nr:hypothetical protein PoB_006658500 [Plakobranchus ocellatus]